MSLDTLSLLPLWPVIGARIKTVGVVLQLTTNQGWYVLEKEQVTFKRVPFQSLQLCLIPNSAIYIQCRWYIFLLRSTPFLAEQKQQPKRPKPHFGRRCSRQTRNNTHGASADRFPRSHAHSHHPFPTSSDPALTQPHPASRLRGEVRARWKRHDALGKTCALVL